MEKNVKNICVYMYTWASLVAQMVKNPPAMLARTLDQEDPLEEGMATHSSILAWKFPMDRAAWLQSWGFEELDTVSN